MRRQLKVSFDLIQVISEDARQASDDRLLLVLSEPTQLQPLTQLGEPVRQTAAMSSSSVNHLSPRVLLLWDVDHTLVETRGVGFALYRRAFKAATGKDMERLAQVSGCTELAIVAETLRLNGLEQTDEAMTRLAGALINGYEAAKDELPPEDAHCPALKKRSRCSPKRL